ncbi:hypothetical protein AUR66_18080 [Haloferax profundi]|uniref:Uncharacterized protein n=1 Tax=Haloferax profundi TaxID=1544718 RepID=A0A0W1S0W4_9EURY|nr:hypothetical protein AUR66_18080 [Haloferax profundi]
MRESFPRRLAKLFLSQSHIRHIEVPQGLSNLTHQLHTMILQEYLLQLGTSHQINLAPRILLTLLQHYLASLTVLSQMILTESQFNNF